MKRTVLVLGLWVGLAVGSATADDGAALFTGRIVYEQSAQGESAGAQAFRGLAASRIRVYFSKKAYRQDEEGGMNAGSVIVRHDPKGVLFLDPKERRTERGGAMDLEQQDEQVKRFMPWHFRTDLEPLEETGSICGYPVRKYRVKKSAFVKKDAVAHVWVAETLKLPSRRYQFEFETRRFTSPLPLSIPISKGAILKVHVLDAGVSVMIVAAEVTPGEPEASLFTKPSDYEGPDFPATPKPVQAAHPKAALSEAEIKKLPATITSGIGMKLVLVHPGVFQMGSPAEEAHRLDNELQHEVTLSRPYYIGVHEVTQAQWKTVMGAESPSKFKGADLPVESLTWTEARAFCGKLSERESRLYRLPTEAEWAYAARAGEALDYKSLKAHKTWLLAHAWMYFNAEYKTHPVGSLQPNGWGLYDTIGNVGEWTADGFAPFTQGAVKDPLGVESERKVIRGNGWISSYDSCRVAQRSAQGAAQAKSTIGFRVVLAP